MVGLLEGLLALCQRSESFVGCMALLGACDSDFGVACRAITALEHSEEVAHEDLTKDQTRAILLRDINLHECWLAVATPLIRDHVLLGRDLELLDFTGCVFELVPQRWVSLVSDFLARCGWNQHHHTLVHTRLGSEICGTTVHNELRLPGFWCWQLLQHLPERIHLVVLKHLQALCSNLVHGIADMNFLISNHELVKVERPIVWGRDREHLDFTLIEIGVHTTPEDAVTGLVISIEVECKLV